MLRQESHIALVLFTRTRAEEARAKDLSGRRHLRTNSLIAGHLIGHAEGTARASGLSCFVIDSDHQHGSSFGEKLANAFEEIYALGYSGVIAIGNDCPTLTPGDLQEAAAALTERQAVIGPAADGGVYLIGLQKQAYDRNRFLALPWATARLAAVLYEEYGTIRNGYHICTLRSDIDSAPQLLHVLSGRRIHLSLLIAIRALLASLAARIARLDADPQACVLRISTGLRAPPAW